MLTLPSLWNLVISTLVFLVAARYFRLYLESKSLSKGLTQSLLVFTIASLVSWGSGEVVDWIQVKIQGSQPVIQSTDELSNFLKALDQVSPTKSLKE